MSTTLNARYEFAPPPAPGLLRGLALAIAAHGLLLVFLGMGVQWKHLLPPVTAEAELWSAVPMPAAEPAPEPAPPAPPEPSPQVDAPKPQPVVAPPVEVKPTPAPTIAIAKEKIRLKNEKLAKLEQERREVEAVKAKKLLAEKEQREKLAKDKLEREKLAQKKINEDAAAKNAAKNAAKVAAEEKKLAELRQENMKRLTGLAAGTGEPGSRGTAAQSSGPSAGYAGKISARIRANITYTESITNNSAAEVLVRVASGGTILSIKLVKSSGTKSWDEAVINAIEKTETLPADTNGKVPSELIILLRPKD